MTRVLFGLLAFTTLACAARAPLAVDPDPGDPPLRNEPHTAHGEITFPRPDRERCGSETGAPYRLTLRMRDEQGSPFPRADMYLFPMGAGGEALLTVRTNDTGVANAVVTRPGVYAVVAAVGGYHPQVRALTMRAGCSGSAVFTLKLGPVVVPK